MLIVMLSAPLGVLCCYLAFLCICRRQHKVAVVLALCAALFLGVTVAISGFMIYAREGLKDVPLELSGYPHH